MSDDGSAGDDDGPTGDATEEVPRPTGEVFLAPVPRSALVGLMAEPLSRSIPVRRSTVLMVVAFLGFGTLMALYPPAPKAVTTASGPTVIPGVLPATTTTTTTHPEATTTTVPPTTTSSTGAGGPTTTTPTTTTTTTTSHPGASSTTTTTGTSTTTTTRVGTSTTTTTTAVP